MYEVELKVPAKHGPVRDRLAALEATAAGTVTQVDRYFDRPDRSFAETDEALRIRREREDGDETVELTYKGPREDATAKTREELETVVGDGTILAEILARIGLQPAATVHKERERYDLEAVTVVLDAVDGLGAFVEVEAACDPGAVAEGEETVVAAIERLGLDPADAVQESYLELLARD